MANTVILNGYFGVKQAFWVSDPEIVIGWQQGHLFIIEGSGTSGAAELKGAVGARGPFVEVCDTSGSAIAGVALEGSAENATAVAGMQHPSGSKVTLLHGHSSFFISYDGTATSATTRNSGGAPWEVEIESASLMDVLYASANGKFCAEVGSSNLAAAIARSPIGYLSQVPATGNGWTMGVVLFG